MATNKLKKTKKGEKKHIRTKTSRKSGTRKISRRVKKTGRRP